MGAFIDFTVDSIEQDHSLLFSHIANDLCNQGFSILPNALPVSLAEKLYVHATAMSQDDFTHAAIGRHQRNRRSSKVRSQMQKWIENDSDTNSCWLDWAAQLQTHLNRHLFLGLFTFESQYALYRPGDFYRRHYDAFKGESSRTLSVIVYLNKDWLESDGGELVLYQSDADLVGIKVRPSFATVVVFMSDAYPHEVLRANRDRFSVAGWFSPNISNPLLSTI